MIINVFNYTWFILVALAVAYIIFVTKKFSSKTEEEKLSFLLKQSIFLCVFWVLYKVQLGFDAGYADLFEFWNELPLQPCNTVCWLSIIACVKKNKNIMAYSFYAGTVFALMALLMPSPGFYGISIFTPRCIGYYGTHLLVAITGILFATLGLFKIEVKSAIKADLCFLEIATIMHAINIIMRATVYPDASYYYTFGKDTNAILTTMHNIIPINYVYLLPFIALAIPIFIAETYAIKAIGQLIRKCKDRN